MLSRILAGSCFAALSLALLISASARGDEPHPIAAQVKSDLKDASKPFTMLVHLRVKEGVQDKFEAAFAKAVKATRKEKGALAYDLNRDAKDATRYLVYERWQSVAHLDAHLKSEHITALLGELKDLLAGDPDVKVLVPTGE